MLLALNLVVLRLQELVRRILAAIEELASPAPAARTIAAVIRVIRGQTVK